MRGLLIVALMGALLSAFGASGCKNVCEKAIGHVMGCMEDFCEQEPTHSTCAQMAERAAEAPECDERAAEQAEALLRQDCDVLTSAFRQYVSAAQTVEATINVREIAQGARWYYESEHVSPSGVLLPYQFPGSVARTPATVPCGERVAPNASDWEHPVWQALSFAPRDPHYFAYQFDAQGSGDQATFTVSAFGDLDCDGQLSTFVISGQTPNANVEMGELRTFNEGE